MKYRYVLLLTALLGLVVAIGSLFFLGIYDMDVTLFLLKHRHAAGDFLDIGSNIGYYALLANEVMGEGARIVAAEPARATYRTLVRNVAGKDRIRALELAVAEHAGTVTFIDYGYRHAVFNSTRAHDLPFLRGKGEEYEVPATTLDSLCETEGLSPSLVKLDTEGTEAGILRSATETLERHAPVILLEVGGGDEWKENNAEALDILEARSYSLFELAEDGTLLPHERQESYAYKNLVCIPESKLSLYVR